VLFSVFYPENVIVTIDRDNFQALSGCSIDDVYPKALLTVRLRIKKPR